MVLCPCGSSRPYSDCCEPLITGKRTAETAEQMMRSRYSAYSRVEIDYIYETTHPDHRADYDPDGTRKWAEESEWEGLEIVSTKDGGSKDERGEVEFVARFCEQGVLKSHHEIADFRKLDGKWYFTDGRSAPQKPLVSSKIGRNEPCPCGSGAKFKKCCGK